MEKICKGKNIPNSSVANVKFRSFLFYVSILFVYGILATGEVLGTTETFDASTGLEDTYVNQGSPSSSYGSWDTAYAGANGDNEYWALFKWNLSSLTNVTITSVTAKFYCSDYLGNLMTPEVYKVTSSWTESSTWSSKPSYGGSDIGHDDLSSSSIDTWYEVDASGLIAIVQGWVDSSSTNYGLVIRHDAYGDLRLAEFRTEDYGSLEAQLIVTYTPCTPPIITLHPQSQTVCEGGSVTFNVSATGTTPSYQWRKNSVDIPGKTNSSYPINPVAPGDAGSYDCVVTNACGSPTSNAATLTVNTIPVLPDIDDDGDVDFEDFAILASHYLDTGCSCPEWCESADLDWSGSIDFTDVYFLCQDWLEGTVQAIEDDFETGDFTKLDWQHAGDANWTIVSDEVYEESYPAKSSSILDNQQSILEITVDTQANRISFAMKVSSESNWDFLRFYVDGEQKDEWSGEQGWTEQTFVITEGQHTFKWAYEKDASLSSGSDCAWIDNISIYPTIIIPPL